MSRSSLFFLGLALLSCVWASEDQVLVLTEANFDEQVKANPKMLVKFYAPWCGHCKKLAPEYEKAAEMLEGKGVVLAKVDATVEKDLGTKFAVKGYPTLMWFADGNEPQEFDGGRSAEGIVEWIDTMTGPAVREVTEAEEPLSKPALTLYAPELSTSFEKYASANRKEASFMFVKSDKKKVTLKHKGEDAIELTDAAAIEDAERLKKFVDDNAFPLFGELNGETYAKYTSAENKGLVWVLYKMESSDEFPKVVDENRAVMTAIAKEFKAFAFTYIDTVQFKGAVENMLGVKEFPAVVAFKKAGDKLKYVHQGEITSATVKKFLSEVEDGTLTPTLRSEEVPEDNDGPVLTVVGKTLEAEVMNAKHDVLFEIYAPWCGHCKKLDPEYEKVAKKIRKEGLEGMIRLVKMDGTANDSPTETISWEGFPTIYYVPAGGSPVKYEGGRTAKDIWKYIKSNHSKADELLAQVKANKAAKPADEKDEL